MVEVTLTLESEPVMNPLAAPKSNIGPTLTSFLVGVPATQDQPPTFIAPSAEEVANRAYMNYLNHGAVAGNDLEDWLGAEAELIAERQHAVTKP